MITTYVAYQSQSILPTQTGMLNTHTLATHVAREWESEITRKHETGTTLHNRIVFCLFADVDGKKGEVQIFGNTLHSKINESQSQSQHKTNTRPSAYSESQQQPHFIYFQRWIFMICSARVNKHQVTSTYFLIIIEILFRFLWCFWCFLPGFICLYANFCVCLCNRKKFFSHWNWIDLPN